MRKRGKPYSRVILEESENHTEVIFCVRVLGLFWARDRSIGEIRYPTFADAVMGLADKYLQAAKKRGALGRKDRRKFAKRIAQRLVH